MPAKGSAGKGCRRWLSFSAQLVEDLTQPDHSGLLKACSDVGELTTPIGRRGQRPNSAGRRVDTEAARDKLQRISEGTANQFAMEKAIASGNGRLMRKAKLAANTPRLKRLRAAYEDDQ